MRQLEHTHYTVTQARKTLARGYQRSQGSVQDFTDVRGRYIAVDDLEYYGVNFVSVGGLHEELEREAVRTLSNFEQEIASGYYLPGRRILTPLQKFEMWTDLLSVPFRMRHTYRRRLLLQDYKLAMELNDWYLDRLADLEDYYAKKSEFIRKYGVLLPEEPDYEEDYE